MIHSIMKSPKQNLLTPPIKRKRKVSFDFNLNNCSTDVGNTPKKQTLKDERFVILNSQVKNPVIYPKNMNKFMKIGSGKMLMGSKEWFYHGDSFMKKKKIQSFDERIKDDDDDTPQPKKHLKGILRWDHFTFENKDLIFYEEGKKIRKKLKNKKLLKQIRAYRESRIKEAEENFKPKMRKIDHGNSKGISNTQRKDMFGNLIKKGGKTHRVCFSHMGSLKVVKSWKTYNFKNTTKPDKWNIVYKKKKCTIF